MSKLLTIIIPTYNMESYLHTCLSSLILPEMEHSAGGSSSTGVALPRQTGEPGGGKKTIEEGDRGFEALVIIDGATDRSEDIAREYAAKYPDTFRVIVKENGHYGSCINRGLQEAQGKYIKVLDADDYFDTQAFVGLLHLLQDIDADAILHFARIFYHDGSFGGYIGIKPDAYKNILGNKNTLTIEEFVIHKQLYPQMHNLVYRTEHLRQMHYSQIEGIPYSDNQWRIMPLGFAKTVAFFPHILYMYLLGRPGQSVDQNYMRNHFDSEIKLIDAMCKEYSTYNFPTVGKQYVETCILVHLNWLYAYGINNESFNERDIRKLDKVIRLSSPYLWDKLSDIEVHIYDYRQTITVNFWRKCNHRLFDLLEGTLKLIWDPYKQVKGYYTAYKKK